jgi:hypothetical protein
MNNMGVYCISCGEEYEKEVLEVSDKCFRSVCNYGHITEIDEMIAPAILEFNKKCYHTLFCCSGHITNYSSSLYVYFDPNITSVLYPQLDSLPEEFDIEYSVVEEINMDQFKYGIKKDIPHDEIEEYLKSDELVAITIRYRVDELVCDLYDRMDILMDVNLQLYDFALHLSNWAFDEMMEKYKEENEE